RCTVPSFMSVHDPTPSVSYPLSLHDALPISVGKSRAQKRAGLPPPAILRYPYMPSLSQPYLAVTFLMIPGPTPCQAAQSVARGLIIHVKGSGSPLRTVSHFSVIKSINCYISITCEFTSEQNPIDRT